MDRELYNTTLQETFYYPPASSGGSSSTDRGNPSAKSDNSPPYPVQSVDGELLEGNCKPDVESFSEKLDVEYNLVRNIIEAQTLVSESKSSNGDSTIGNGQSSMSAENETVIQDILRRSGIDVGANLGVVKAAEGDIDEQEEPGEEDTGYDSDDY